MVILVLYIFSALVTTTLALSAQPSSSSASAKLQAHQQAAKARRAMVEKGLLKEGIELEELNCKIESRATGFASTGGSSKQITEMRAKLLQQEATIIASP